MFEGRDLAPDEVKSLRVRYTVDGGKTQQTQVAEHAWLRPP